jgi:hypothetical protein
MCSDEVCGYFRKLAAYHDRLAHEGAAVPIMKGVRHEHGGCEVLGHIFEQTVTGWRK